MIFSRPSSNMGQKDQGLHHERDHVVMGQDGGLGKPGRPTGVRQGGNVFGWINGDIRFLVRVFFYQIFKQEQACLLDIAPV